MKKNDDKRRINIEFWYDPKQHRKHHIENIEISMLYLTKNNIDEWKFLSKKDRKEGYIISLKINMSIVTKIEYISKEYFEKIYNKFENIKFKTVAIEGCDDNAEILFVELGILELGRFDYYNRYSQILRVSIPPSDLQEKSGKEYIKLMKIINDIKNKVNYEQWYNDTQKKWDIIKINN